MSEEFCLFLTITKNKPLFSITEKVKLISFGKKKENAGKFSIILRWLELLLLHVLVSCWTLEMMSGHNYV